MAGCHGASVLRKAKFIKRWYGDVDVRQKRSLRDPGRQKKTPRLRGFFTSHLTRESGRLNVGSLLAFGALRDFELYFLTFFKGFETIHLDRGEMCEQIFSPVIRRDESETLGVVEPLDCTCCHKSVFQICLITRAVKARSLAKRCPLLKLALFVLTGLHQTAISMKFIVLGKNMKVKLFC